MAIATVQKVIVGKRSRSLIEAGRAVTDSSVAVQKCGRSAVVIDRHYIGQANDSVTFQGQTVTFQGQAVTWQGA